MPKTIQWLDKSDLDRVAISIIQPCNIAVDIGTGIRPHDFVASAICICFEPYSEYVDILKKKAEEKFDKIYVVEQKTWSGALESFTEKSVDTVFLIDVIEHLPKDEGEILLKRTERIARQQIVIFTPLGFVAQHTLEGGKDAWGLDGAEWQEHKSGWLPEDFDDTWEVYACRDYHEYNNVNEKLEEAFGAFWAIKTFDDGQKSPYVSLTNKVYDSIRSFTKKMSENMVDLNKLQSENEMLKTEYLVSLEKNENFIKENENLVMKNERFISEKNEFASLLSATISELNGLKAEYCLLENTKAVRFARFIGRKFRL